MNTFQHPLVEGDLSDIVDLTGAGVALVVGADKVVLGIVLVSITGTVVQFRSAISAADKPGENTGLSRFGRPSLVFPKHLYPFPLPHFNNRRLCALKYPLILFWIFHPFFEFQRFGIGLEIDGTTGTAVLKLLR